MALRDIGKELCETEWWGKEYHLTDDCNGTLFEGVKDVLECMPLAERKAFRTVGRLEQLQSVMNSLSEEAWDFVSPELPECAES